MATTILITGATGKVSSGLIRLLQSSGVQLRALVRSAARAGDLGGGVEIVEGDLEKPKTLPRAFEGVDTLWLLCQAGPRAPEQSSNGLWAARQAGVKKVVRLSVIGAALDAPTINTRLHALSDEELAASGLDWTLLMPHSFMQNLLGNAHTVAAQGALYHAGGDARMGMVDARDISELAAHVLTSNGHSGKRYTVTGPKSISLHEVAEALSRAVGRPIKYVPVPIAAAEEAMAKAGVDEWRIHSVGDYLTAFSRGWSDVVSEDFPRLMGKPARSIDDFAATYAAAFGKK
jgi:uncharacterized protein YbjT (DUF2867 family)